jgi:hypothetical protein
LRKHSRFTHRLFLTGDDARMLASWMYLDATVWLGRKRGALCK